MTITKALKIVGGLSRPSKMPSWSYGFSREHCQTGAKLEKLTNSICNICYAGKGCYKFKSTIKAHKRRYLALQDPQWVEAMVTLINKKKIKYFRWHDSGDLQGRWHLDNILSVCRQTPECKHWLPTKESKLVLGVSVPDNLVIRVSSPIIDMRPLKTHEHTSTVHHLRPPHGIECSAPTTGGNCKDCRACWDRSVKNVSYKRH